VLSAALTAGYPFLGLAVLLGAFGAPLPLNVALSAAGALARQGRLDLVLLFAMCVIAAVGGDCLGYALGRYGFGRLPAPRCSARLTRRLKGPVLGFSRLQAPMGPLVFLTRWAVTAPAPVVNVVAGMRHYSWRSFLIFDLTGETLWCATALVPGYLLGASDDLGLPAALGAGLALSAGALVLSRRYSLRLQPASRLAGP
jgi:membrane protein DedA with SNARE-associated domain